MLKNFKTLTASLLAIVILSGCSVIREQQTLDHYVEDAAITAQVKARLAIDPIASASSIRVQTMHRSVQLSGFTKTKAEAMAAIEVARSTLNVDKVINSLNYPE